MYKRGLLPTVPYAYGFAEISIVAGGKHAGLVGNRVSVAPSSTMFAYCANWNSADGCSAATIAAMCDRLRRRNFALSGCTKENRDEVIATDECALAGASDCRVFRDSSGSAGTGGSARPSWPTSRGPGSRSGPRQRPRQRPRPRSPCRTVSSGRASPYRQRTFGMRQRLVI